MMEVYLLQNYSRFEYIEGGVKCFSQTLNIFTQMILSMTALPQLSPDPPHIFFCPLPATFTAVSSNLAGQARMVLMK